jgi:hypothetical protein
VAVVEVVLAGDLLQPSRPRASGGAAPASIPDARADPESSGIKARIMTFSIPALELATVFARTRSAFRFLA